MASNHEEFFYPEAAYLVCLVLGRNCRMKTALYETSFKTDLRRLYALGCNTLNNYMSLTNVLTNSGLLSQTSDSSSHLTSKERDSSDACLQCSLCVLAHDLILGSKRAGNRQLLMRKMASISGDPCAVKKIRQAYRELKVNTSKQTDIACSAPPYSYHPNQLNNEDIRLPCYARVNLLVTTLDEVLDSLNALGFEQRRHDPTKDSYKRFLKRVKRLKVAQFLLDHHLPEELLVFPAGSKLYQLDLVKSHRFLLQDKASCIPPNILNPVRDEDVLDACAAPGNKTLQLIHKLSSKSTLFAVDRDPTRFRRLCSHLAESGVQRLSIDGPVSPRPNFPKDSIQPRVEAICTDFLTLEPQDPRFARVQSILLDPSCSGSGLQIRQPDGATALSVQSKQQSIGTAGVADRPGEDDALLQSEHPDQRLKRLANLQAQLLRHAFKFPNVKRVVYSTCSVYPEENEQVVAELLSNFGNLFTLESIWSKTKETEHDSDDSPEKVAVHSPVWENRGLPEYDCEACLRAFPNKDLTNGFFVACFRRVSDAKSAIKRPHEVLSNAHSCVKRPRAERLETCASVNEVSKRNKKRRKTHRPRTLDP